MNTLTLTETKLLGDIPHFHYQIILTSTLASSMCEFFWCVEEKWKPSLRSVVL